MISLYDEIGKGYSIGRKTDPKIAHFINQYLHGSESIVNIGAGTGSYEPDRKKLIAVEPSSEMIRQRPKGSHPVQQASAESLPFKNGCFSHAMTILSMHHWENRKQAFSEIKRVVRQRFITLTWNPDADKYWLTRDYFPEIHDIDKSIFPALSELEQSFKGIRFYSLPIPAECIDGFTAAYWSRPEAYLDSLVRKGMSTFSKIQGLEVGVQKLKHDIDSGLWQSKYGELKSKDSLDVGYVVGVWDA